MGGICNGGGDQNAVCLRVGDFLRLYMCLMDTVFHMFKFQRISPLICSWLFPKSEHSAAAKRTVRYYIMLVTKKKPEGPFKLSGLEMQDKSRSNVLRCLLCAEFFKKNNFQNSMHVLKHVTAHVLPLL